MWNETKQDQKTALNKTFEFADFAQAFEFMIRVAKVAEGVQHHPKWTNEYNKVEIWLSTHSAGDKVTSKDRQLAEAIDAIASEFIV
jgi:4a-hydroxytetrahydrobiopterin dehydratase